LAPQIKKMLNNILSQIEIPPILAFKKKASAIEPKQGFVFDMTQAVPSFPTFSKIIDHLRDELLKPENSFYSDVPGDIKLRSEIIKHHPCAKNLSPDDLIITAGANHAAYTALTLHFNIGDKILLPEPYYFNHDMALKMLGLESCHVKMDSANGFQLDADLMIEQFKKTKAKGLILVTPNNPTGVIYKSSEILKLLNWTSTKKIQIIIDETYMRFDKEHLHLSEISKFIGHGLSLVGSFSKTLSLTGYRVGYLIQGVNFFENVLKIQDTMVICAPTLAQKAALFGLKECDQDVQDQIDLINERQRILSESSKNWTRFKLCSFGAYFAFIQHPFEELSSEEAALKLFQETGILTLPGAVFGLGQSRFLRFAYANIHKTELGTALKNLCDFDQLLGP